MTNLNEEAVEVQCTRPDPLADGTHCNYRWKTRSKLLTVSCPNCRFPNNVAKAKAKELENSTPMPEKKSTARSHRSAAQVSDGSKPGLQDAATNQEVGRDGGVPAPADR